MEEKRCEGGKEAKKGKHLVVETVGRILYTRLPSVSLWRDLKRDNFHDPQPWGKTDTERVL